MCQDVCEFLAIFDIDVILNVSSIIYLLQLGPHARHPPSHIYCNWGHTPATPLHTSTTTGATRPPPPFILLLQLGPHARHPPSHIYCNWGHTPATPLHTSTTTGAHTPATSLHTSTTTGATRPPPPFIHLLQPL